MAEPRSLQFKLNPNGVAAIAQRVTLVASHVVGTTLRALENDDLAPPEMQGGTMGYNFTGLEMTNEEKRTAYRNWILSKGFQDLARGVREALEEAIFYLVMIKREPGLTTWGKIQNEMAEIRANAARMPFPKLMEKVNEGLAQSLSFDAEFLSLQKVRNCLGPVDKAG
jgi:hypothetical protein